ncbi:MAG TPA: hypothetical protein VMM13_04110, partial [Euzebya sp.]|nr:hypothetical protein [Euzebya sp.]
MHPVVALSIAVVLVVAVAVLPQRLTAVPDVAPDQPVAAAEPGEGLLSARLAAGGAAPDGQAYAAALRQASAVAQSPLASLNPWQDRGPRNVGGRLTDLALAPGGETVYAAAASGGLWASTDGGVTLQPVWPPDLTPAIGAVAATADGILLVGTGEANAGGGSLTFGGTGVYRSVDGGASWIPAGLETSGSVARIVPHPSRPDRVYLAAGGDLFAPGGQRGIYRSDDAGQTWDLVLPPATPTAGGADIAIDPADPAHLLATMWDRLRTPDLRRYGGPGSGLYTSRDGGDTWTPVAGGLPGFAQDSGRIAVDFSPADPSRVYAVVTRGDGRSGGLWRSDDGGQTWARVDDSPLYAPSQFIFGWWFSKVFAAPEDPDRVLVPGLSLLESRDGGVTFTPDDLVHADQHDLVWDPADPQRAWLATDGGLYASTRGGASLTWRPTDDQGFTQLYDVAVPPADADRLAGGFQDNGCLLTAGADDGWGASASCGDGVVILPHPHRGDELILCGQHGRCRISADFGVTSLILPMPVTTRQNWSAPLMRVPGSPEELLYGAVSVHRSIDGGLTWQAISGDLTRGRSPDPDYPFGTVTALAADGAGTIAAGTDDGLVWRSPDDGATWDQVA